VVTHALNIPSAVVKAQQDASDPSGSAWVSANAGSGKTHVLAQRVIRLLLRGTKPERILCLTYTKAAAANMSTRVFDTLAKWTAMDATALDAEIIKIEGRHHDARLRTRARRLFAQALDTPGGLKVQTIHAFCTRLLHQFPFEANVAARFEVLDERTQSELIDRLRMTVLLEAADKPESDLGRALAAAIPVAADQTFAEVIGETIMRSDELMRWLERVGGVKGAVEDLSQALGVGPEDTSESVAIEFFSKSLIPPSEHASVAATLMQGLDTDKSNAAILSSLPTLEVGARVSKYIEIFCKVTDGKPRARVATKGIKDNYPALFDRLVREQERVVALIAKRRAIETRERTAALITIAAEIIARYRVDKTRRGLLDYDDLIDRTLHLLVNESAKWVHYKLDLGIDHVLIDEAQDTSEKQWAIVQALTAEFMAGIGAREVSRSIFAVGDEKQSIFSFQGAEPAQFGRMQRYYSAEHRKAEMRFTDVSLQHSFRSVPIVLSAVDAVFESPVAHAGLTEVAGKTIHQAVRANAPGHVELWKLEEPEKKPRIEGWDAPFDEAQETSPRTKLARRIAVTIKRWIDRREPVAEGRAVRPGDILVLVRQRGALFEAVIRALKEAEVPVAGADRLTLTQHIAVMDLIALADALLLPHDDLALASVLKSPLFGLSEDQLFALAYKRKGTLRAALLARANDLEFADAYARLERYAAWAQHETPFGFYARILGADRGRARFYARLGPEAADALDEFLEHALAYEREGAPTLQGFVAWLRTGETQVKRDMDIARDEVRVMTVHGAKGLEAPVVFLADTTTAPKGPREPRLLAMPVPNAAPDTPDRIVWAGRKADDAPPVATAREAAVLAATNESRRLLYVAMTRAADRLVIAGSRGEQRMPEGCWYQLIDTALKAEAVEESDEDGPVLRWRKGEALRLSAEADNTSVSVSHDAPPWLHQSAAPASEIPRTISPSTAADRGATTFGDAAALARGRAVHRLLQALPALPADRRAEAAQQYLKRARDVEPSARAKIAAEVLAVIGDPQFAALFAEGSRAEVPIVGTTPSGLRVSGQTDRLAVTATEVLIADYKSDRYVPSRAEDIPQTYISQLALYRGILCALYPNHRVRAALVWTAAPALTELPAAALDQAMSRLSGP
jgi:ATP-dependent helicase/nuclease subunit A